MSDSQKKIVNARRINKMRWVAGLAMSLVVVAITVVSLSMNIADVYNEGGPEAGLGTLRMFTTISNVIAAVAAFMCLPFQIDGLRKDKYRLPSWIVLLLYIGAVGTFLTFFIAITLLSITQGFVIIMFRNSNLFMHTINPIFITILFVLVISDHRIKFLPSLFGLIPITVYAFIYFIMVFVAGVWRDHYQANSIIPWPLTLLIILALSFGISQLLRFLHNLTHKYIEGNLTRYYLESEDFACPRVSDAVAKLAEIESKFYHEGDDIYIPVDIIALLGERYGASSLPVDILYDIYLESFLIHIGKGPKAKEKR